MFVIVSEVGDEIGNPCLKDNDPIVSQSSLQHKICRSHARVIKISSTHKVIVCPTCCLRIPIPVDVNTYGDLEKHFSLLNKPSGTGIET